MSGEARPGQPASQQILIKSLTLLAAGRYTSSLWTSSVNLTSWSTTAEGSFPVVRPT